MSELYPCKIRPARESDVPDLIEIYRPFIEQATTSFELEVPSVAEFAQRVAASQERHAWLVAEDDAGILGYAYGGAHRSREAYRYTAEVSAYLADRARGKGLGAQLYERLFVRLNELGYCNAVAGVTLPNDPSVAFHERMGFTSVGVYRRIGFKFGRWCDVAWYERPLREGDPDRLPEIEWPGPSKSD
ncbi:MAG: N-acetyltransferase family protein [Planctomycetota bacterium]